MENILNPSPAMGLKFLCRMMRLTIIALFVFVGTAFGTESYSQVKRVTVVSNDISLKNVINQIEKQTNYLFVYNMNDINLNKNVSINARNQSVLQVLKEIFNNTNINFVLEGKNILLVKDNRMSHKANSQQATKNITGKVVDSKGDPIIGASVVDKDNAGVGVATDVNGHFSIAAKPGVTLVISYIGFESKKITVKAGESFYTVELTENVKVLDEVLVVAFGKMKKEAFTGSAGVVKSDELMKSQVTNPVEALAGRVAGVQLSSSSFQLGSSPSITIRGFGSISSDTEPLIVVDGMPYDGDLNLINPSDIESMTVLKDAASNALYGARGANGVLMITTKRGKIGASKITFDSKWGANSNGLRNYKTTNSKQFYETYYKMLYNYYVSSDGGSMSASDAHGLANKNLVDSSTGVGPGYMVYTVPTGQDFIQAGGVMNPGATMGAPYSYNGQQFWLQADDWQKEGLRDGFRQEYNTTISGASDKVNYYTSFGYLDQQGIQVGSSQKRLSSRVKLDYQAKKWLKVGTNFNYTKYDNSQTSEGTVGTGTIWSTIKTLAPIYPVYLRDAKKNIMIDQWGEKMYDFGRSYDLSRAGDVGGNCIFDNKYRTSDTDGNSFIASGYGDINIMDGLVFTFNANTYNYNSKYTYATSPFADYYTGSSDNGYLYKSSSRTYTYNTQQLLNYNKQFGKHDISAMLGHEYYKYKFEFLSASGHNFGIDGTNDLATCLNLNGDPSSYSSDYNNEGFFFRGMYNYDSKYYGSVSYRRDASSRFAKKHRWGDFWSVGAAWLISKESFFNVPWVNSLKFKVSVGSQGNDNIGNYLYADSYTIVNNNNEAAYQWRQKGSENITWETNTNWNTGFEFELFNRRLSGSLDYFSRKTTDMLFSLNTPPSIGYTSYYINLGDMRNSGIELSLSASLINNKDMHWDVNFNITHVKNQVLKLPDAVKTTVVEGHKGYVNLDKSFVSMYDYFVTEGKSLYTWYLPKYAGVDKETGEAMYYKDTVDSNGKVTGRETTKDPSLATNYIIGDALPKFYGGFGTSFSYRGFDFSINLNYQLGGKSYDYTYQTLMHTGGTTNTTWSKDIFKAWTPENKNTDVPRLMFSEKYSQNARSDRFLKDASYLSVQNINIGYTLPSSLTRKFSVDNMRVYFSGENLFYISGRQGFDPRYSLKGVTNPELYSPIRTISGGISLTF